MKSKFLFLATVIAIIGLNLSVCYTSGSRSYSLSSFMKFNSAEAEGGYDNCYQNWQSCELTDTRTGITTCTCEDPCNADSGEPCSEAIACAAGIGIYVLIIILKS